MHLPDPDRAGLFHVVGIGGIGMSAIAEVMHTRGYRVQVSAARRAFSASPWLSDRSDPRATRGRRAAC